jgi:nucleotide-binding universal stress UspA family protein
MNQLGRRRGSTSLGQRGPKRLRSVLVALDLTPSSERAVGRLSRLSLEDDVKVTLLHVVPESLSPPQQRAAQDDAKRALAHEAQRLRQIMPQGARVELALTRGKAANEIGDCAARAKAELIIVGRGGRSRLRDALLGSTAERVIRKARLPVLVARLPPRAAYRRPALALELDDAADEVVRLILRLLPAPRPFVTVIHAYEVSHAGLVYPSLSHVEMEETNAELRRRATVNLLERLTAATLKWNVAPEDVPAWRAHVREGAPRLIVPRAVEKIDTDLLVLGTRGRSRPASVFLGTVAGDLLRDVRCDVLVVPPVAARD